MPPLHSKWFSVLIYTRSTEGEITIVTTVIYAVATGYLAHFCRPIGR